MQDTYPDYTPQPANLEYVMATIFATWAADIASLCSAGGTELFTQYGAQLFNLPAELGSSATATIQIVAADDSGYTLPSGQQFLLDGVAGFQTFVPTVIPSGSTSATATIAANTPGSAGNGLGAQSCVMNTGSVGSLSWVLNVILVSESSGGVDAETSDEYVQRLAETIQLSAPRPITASDYGTMSLSFTPEAGTDQEEVGRGVAIDGYDPTVTPFTGTTNGTVTVTGVAPTTGISINSIISAANIPLGTTVVDINGSSAATATASASANVLTLSQSTSSSITSESMISTGTYYNERCVTVCVTDSNGLALNSDTMTALSAWLESLRELNFVVNVIAPTYNPIYLTVSVYRNVLYSASDVQAAVQASLLTLFSPSGWGIAADSSGTIWSNTVDIYQSVVEAAIQNTAGVDHISTGSLHIGLSPSPATWQDVQLVGPFPLPQATDLTIPVTAVTVLN